MTVVAAGRGRRQRWWTAAMGVQIDERPRRRWCEDAWGAAVVVVGMHLYGRRRCWWAAAAAAEVVGRHVDGGGG